MRFRQAPQSYRVVVNGHVAAPAFLDVLLLVADHDAGYDDTTLSVAFFTRDKHAPILAFRFSSRVDTNSNLEHETAQCTINAYPKPSCTSDRPNRCKPRSRTKGLLTNSPAMCSLFGADSSSRADRKTRDVPDW